MDCRGSLYLFLCPLGIKQLGRRTYTHRVDFINIISLFKCVTTALRSASKSNKKYHCYTLWMQSSTELTRLNIEVDNKKKGKIAKPLIYITLL